MHVNHGRLIKSILGSDEVTHHCCPKNGLVHDGHPLYCADQVCRSWAASFVINGEPGANAYEPETQQKLVDDQVRDDERRQMVLAVTIVAIVVVALIAALIWFCRR